MVLCFLHRKKTGLKLETPALAPPPHGCCGRGPALSVATAVMAPPSPWLLLQWPRPLRGYCGRGPALSVAAAVMAPPSPWLLLPWPRPPDNSHSAVLFL
ncbi:hypothetical protein D4764_13G0008600 [Takifugu flavidus]|uniref:Uncharacterized protein n=1 Tax=Takifugu flavidus TaxID=433684 RepID=A0A5C6PBR5_9TELE|nr:hypothetical protein D4764_13G0008600 [Takifugu flavidus]